MFCVFAGLKPVYYILIAIVLGVKQGCYVENKYIFDLSKIASKRYFRNDIGL